MSGLSDALGRLVSGQRPSPAEIEAAVGDMMDGRGAPAEVAAFLTALRMRGEGVEEIVAAVRALRARAVRVAVDGPIVDTCGTGGDGLGTFNISTAAAFVAAAAGLRVAKHGNRAASGRVGAADVLEACGVRIEVGPAEAASALERIGICFLFAPHYHPAFRHVAGVRRELGFRTLFNLTGPLCNPAGATRQVIGLFAREWLDVVAAAMAELGTEHAMLVHGDDGSDEISAVAPTAVVELRDGRTERYEVRPGDFGFETCTIADLAGGDARDNARILRSVLGGAPGPPARAVALNAGAAIYVGGGAVSLEEGVRAARELLASGQPLAKLDDLKRFTAGGQS